MSELFWLNDKQWAKLEPLLPPYIRGKRRVDDRRIETFMVTACLTAIVAFWLKVIK